jgi:hypothetical protein
MLATARRTAITLSRIAPVGLSRRRHMPTVEAMPRTRYVIKDKFGTWRYDWGGNSMHKPLG